MSGNYSAYPLCSADTGTPSTTQQLPSHWFAHLSPLIQKRGWIILLLSLDRWNKQIAGGKKQITAKEKAILSKLNSAVPTFSFWPACSLLSQFLKTSLSIFGTSPTLRGLRAQRERVNTSVQRIIFITYANKTHKSSFTAVSPLGSSLK